jgi:hypothetical protein
VLGVGAGVAVALEALTGCDLDPHSTSPAPPVRSRDPDQGVVDAARAELRTLLRRLQATPGATTLVAAHREQLRVLEGHPPKRRRRGVALTKTQVVDEERRALRRFRHWAMTCENGDLARVLACIAAGIAMQTEVRGSA